MHQAALSMPELNDPALLRSQAYVDGAWCAAASSATFEVTNPADGAVIASVPDMGAEDAQRAIDAAAAAFPAWSARTGKERAAILRNWFNLLETHAADLAEMEASMPALEPGADPLSLLPPPPPGAAEA